VDEAIKYNEPLEQFLSQKPEESNGIQECYDKLAKIVDYKPSAPQKAKKAR
jgi:flagellar biosynthesis/type III secretory pathway ATPase